MKGFLNKVSGGAKPTGKAGMSEAGGAMPPGTTNGIEPTPKADISLPKTQARRSDMIRENALSPLYNCL